MNIFTINNTLFILTGIIRPNGTGLYTSFLTTATRVCLGFASWSVNNAAGRTSFLQDPTGVACVPEPFNMAAWANVSSTQLTLSLLQGLGSKSVNNLPAPTAMLNVILATLNHTSSQAQLVASHKAILTSTTLPQAPSACSLSSSPSQPWVIAGIISLHGTGMTLLGAVLQGLIILLGLLTILLLLWPTLPLLSEWPAQWLGLVVGLSPARVQEAVEGTSVGRNEAGREMLVWMRSGGGDVLEGRPWLTLSREKGRVRMGREHV
jgi:hypothetical protein